MIDFVKPIGWVRFIGAVGPDPFDDDFLLLEDGTVLLLEDGSGGILLEP